eukprot:7253937-Prorocentrum_lima.AAC.1
MATLVAGDVPAEHGEAGVQLPGPHRAGHGEHGYPVPPEEADDAPQGQAARPREQVPGHRKQRAPQERRADGGIQPHHEA